MLVLGALCSFLEPFCGHSSPKLDKLCTRLTFEIPHEEPCVERRFGRALSEGVSFHTMVPSFGVVTGWQSPDVSFISLACVKWSCLQIDKHAFLLSRHPDGGHAWAGDHDSALRASDMEGNSVGIFDVVGNSDVWYMRPGILTGSHPKQAS